MASSAMVFAEENSDRGRWSAAQASAERGFKSLVAKSAQGISNDRQAPCLPCLQVLQRKMGMPKENNIVIWRMRSMGNSSTNASEQAGRGRGLGQHACASPMVKRELQRGGSGTWEEGSTSA
jgi:hypothetical protein